MTAKAKQRKLRQAYDDAKVGPSGIGLREDAVGNNYRLWVTTYILPAIAAAGDFEMDTPAVSGSPYPQMVKSS